MIRAFLETNIHISALLSPDDASPPTLVVGAAPLQEPTLLTNATLID
ncbi:MAG: hypothetical protein M3Q03_00645 [Chloroflexota bacterium]|nr:hypothetical protein [Chloroflexota bacterium]